MPSTEIAGLVQTRSTRRPVPISSTPSSTPASCAEPVLGVVERRGRRARPARRPPRRRRRRAAWRAAGHSAVSASGTAPPNMPLCTAWSQRAYLDERVDQAAQRRWSAPAAPMSQLPESAITITSAGSSSRCSREQRVQRVRADTPPRPRRTRPRRPAARRRTRAAPRRAPSRPALSSAAPRPYSRPSRSTGSNGVAVHSVGGRRPAARRGGRRAARSARRAGPGGGRSRPAGRPPARSRTSGSPAAAQQLGDGLGGPFHLAVVEPVERDARDADQAFEVGADPGQLPLDRGAQRVFGERSGHARDRMCRCRRLVRHRTRRGCVDQVSPSPWRLPPVPRRSPPVGRRSRSPRPATGPRLGHEVAYPAHAARPVAAPSPSRRSSDDQRVLRVAETLPVRVGGRLRRRRATDASPSQSRRGYSPPRIARVLPRVDPLAQLGGPGHRHRVAAARAHADLVDAVPQVAAALVLGRLLEERGRVDLRTGRRRRPASSCSRSDAAGSCPASSPARSADSSALRHHSNIAAMIARSAIAPTGSQLRLAAQRVRIIMIVW